MKRTSFGVAFVLALVFVVIFMMVIAASQQAPSTAAGPAPGGASSDERFEKVSELICSDWNKEYSVCLYRRRPQGPRDLGTSFGWRIVRSTSKPPGTVYSLASVTKSMIATGLMVLMRAGRVNLDAPVERYIGPGQLKVYDGRAEDVTVKRLLHHTQDCLSTSTTSMRMNPQGAALDETIRRFAIIVRRPERSSATRIWLCHDREYCRRSRKALASL